MINRRAADRLRDGYLWVYASDIESINVPNADHPPALLPVADSRGLLLGTALYSPASQIALRLVSREALDEPAWLTLLAARLRTAIGRRRFLLDAHTDACRLCFSEADELPGLMIDKYGRLVVLQLLTRGLDSAAVRETCVRVLREELAPAAILERPDPRMRELEGLNAPDLAPLFIEGESNSSTKAHFLLNSLRFEYDANAGQKTGAFLDQRDNYAAARQWAERLGLAGRESGGRALDVCCYQGGFALHLAQVCRQVSGIDASHASLEVAERNYAANREAMKAEVDWVAGDAFQILRDWSDAGEKFDAIVLDPPAFAKTQRAVEGALRGYKELNLRALKMLRPGGLLVTCSCSHHVSWTELEGAVAAAAIDAGRRVRLLERRGAALDHPVVLNLPETEYLKCLILQAD
jgi:23S rRNA (cytosine1962-C5)-methyltransferase